MSDYAKIFIAKIISFLAFSFVTYGLGAALWSIYSWQLQLNPGDWDSYFRLVVGVVICFWALFFMVLNHAE